MKKDIKSKQKQAVKPLLKQKKKFSFKKWFSEFFNNLKTNLISNLKKFVPVLKFFSIFVGIIAAYYLIFFWTTEENMKIFDEYINFTASLSGLILSIFETGVNTAQGTISGPGCAVTLKFGCEGTEPLVIFVAAVLAFPTKWKLKILGAVIGAAFLYILNIIRIVGLYFIQKSAAQDFEIYHVVVFPMIFIFLSIILWGIWLGWTKKRLKPSF